MQVIKYSGESVPFSEEKLRKSLQNVGAGSDTVDEVVEELSSRLFEGITTKEIYKRAHTLLKKREFSKASRYHLKQAILEMGPTGYPFELFIGELMRAQGFQVQVGQVLQGKCVTHEVDVLAQSDNEVLMLECKFHNRNGYKTDVKVPLYIQGRFKDLESVWMKDPAHQGKTFRGGVITNARLTQDAIDYGTCMGLYMLSWDYPLGENSLRNLISKYELQPVTGLQTLTKNERLYLMEREIVTVQILRNKPDILNDLRLPTPRMNRLIREMEMR